MHHEYWPTGRADIGTTGWKMAEYVFRSRTLVASVPTLASIVEAKRCERGGGISSSLTAKTKTPINVPAELVHSGVVVQIQVRVRHIQQDLTETNLFRLGSTCDYPVNMQFPRALRGKIAGR